MALELVPSFNQPGTYFGHFFPMAEGDYTFRIAGDIEGNAMDESFTSSPEGFDSVQPREPLEFPRAGFMMDARPVVRGRSRSGGRSRQYRWG